MSLTLNFDNKVLYNKLIEYFGENKLKLTLKLRNKILIITTSDIFYEIDINDVKIPSFVLGNDDSIIESMIKKNLCNKGIIEFSCGESHYITRTFDNKIYFGNGLNKMKIYEVLNELEIKIIKCGANHTLVLTSNGEVYAWGKNSDGEIGNGCYKDQLTPIKLNDFNDEKVVMISCGGWHSMALTESGRVFSWGYNSIGQLRQGNTINSNIPELIEMKEIKIIKISCGLRHSLLLSNNGNIYTFGDNDRDN
jgi:RCC1 and BTB domain-containing protein